MWNTIYKFSSPLLNSAADIKKIINIIPKNNCVAIFSDFNGCCPKLIEIANISNNHNFPEAKKKFDELKEFHQKICKELSISFDCIDGDFHSLWKIYDGLINQNNLNNALLDKIISYGERFSSKIVSTYARLPIIDSVKIIKTDDNYGHANINEEETKKNFLALQIDTSIIMAGNIGSDKKNNPTTLGLHGSDYTMSLIAEICRTQIVYIWNNIDCIHTIDKKYTSDAIALKHIDYDSLNCLINSGGDLRIMSRRAFNVLHDKNIRIVFKNPYANPMQETIISNETSDKYFLIINDNNKSLFTIKNATNVIDSSSFDVKYKNDNEYKIVVNNSKFNEAKIMLSIYKPDIKQDISLISIIHEPLKENDFNEIVNNLKKNNIPVLGNNYKESIHKSTIIVNVDNYKQALVNIHNYLKERIK